MSITCPPGTRMGMATIGHRRRRLLCCLCSLLLTGGSVDGRQTGTVLHVDDGIGPRAGDGSSWSAAFATLQDALAAAGPGTEIRVAQGLYKPDEGSGQTPGLRSQAFQLSAGITVKGGYAGVSAPDPDLWDPENHPTVLSGDLNEDDWDSAYDDNAEHVIVAQDVTDPAFIVGLRVISGNMPGGRGGGMLVVNSTVTADRCTFTGNRAKFGGGIAAIGLSSVTFDDCTFEGNTATAYGGGLYASYVASLKVTMTLRRCLIVDNDAFQGGALLLSYPAYCRIENTVIRGNRATYGTGAVEIIGCMAGTIVNCLIAHNHSESDNQAQALEPVMDLTLSDLDVVNCAVVDNTAGPSATAGAHIRGHNDVAFLNCIFWNDGSDQPFNGEFHLSGSMRNSIFQGGWTGPGEWNMDLDPQFIDAAGGDYHLAAVSPAVDAGTPDAPGLPAEDLDRQSRIQNCRPDLGPIESSRSFDCNENGLSDGCETTVDPGVDCNDNGVPDTCDLDSGFSADINGNATPDDCEPDCNTNGLPDSYEIDAGLVDDCTLDGIPDECQLPAQYRDDDGSEEYYFGGGAHDVLWLNRCTVAPGGEVITALTVAAAITDETTLATDVIALLYDDPNNDGHPSDARLIAAVATEPFPLPFPLAVEVTTAIRPTFVGQAGDSFFVGGFVTDYGGNAPAPFDQDGPLPSSAYIIGAPNSIDVPTASGGELFFDFAQYNVPGAFILRAHADELDCDQNGIADRCEIVDGVLADENGNLIADWCERPGDVNGDLAVDISDLLDVLSTWGDCPGCATDLDQSTSVDIEDLLIVLGDWG